MVPSGTVVQHLTEYRISTEVNLSNEWLCSVLEKEIFVPLKLAGAMELCVARCCFYVLVCFCPCSSIRGSWGLSPCYILCHLAWSEAFICICSCWPSVTTTACESRPVSERQQLKGKVVFVRSCQMQSKLTFLLPSAFHSHPLYPWFLPLLHISQLMSSQFNGSATKDISHYIKCSFWHLF